MRRYSLSIGPAGHTVHWQQDAFGNHQARVVFTEPSEQLTVAVDLVVDLTTINPFDFLLDPDSATFPFSYEPELAEDLSPYLKPVDEVPGSGQGPGPRLRSWLADLLPCRRQGWTRCRSSSTSPGVWPRTSPMRCARPWRPVAGRHACRRRLRRAVTPRGSSSSALRSLGFAARFVSGYLVQLIGDDVEEASIRGKDLTDLHAWAEAFVPGAGWIGLDATSGLLAGEGHIPLSATPHPDRAAPIVGTVEPCVTTMTFHNRVTRVEGHAAAAVGGVGSATSGDLDDVAWSHIDATGRAVDAALVAGDVRLTMGGEPTFVSATDTQDPMWRVAADGEEKRVKGGLLADRLRERYAPDGVAHHALGKWYPGEPAPRWQVTLTWRRDGVPLWPYPELLDDPLRPADPVDPRRLRDHRRRPHRRRSLPGSASTPAFCQPAYEDALAGLLDEVRLPDGEPPATDVAPWNPPRVPAQAGRCGHRARRHRRAPVGWVIPMHAVLPDDEDDVAAAPVRWATSPWRFGAATWRSRRATCRWASVCPSTRWRGPARPTSPTRRRWPLAHRCR